jgi:hypothetical protein
MSSSLLFADQDMRAALGGTEQKPSEEMFVTCMPSRTKFLVAKLCCTFTGAVGHGARCNHVCCAGARWGALGIGDVAVVHDQRAAAHVVGHSCSSHACGAVLDKPHVNSCKHLETQTLLSEAHGTACVGPRQACSQDAAHEQQGIRQAKLAGEILGG